jgi:hypothetical protein
LLKEQYPGWCKGLSEEEEKQWARSIRDVPSLHDLKVHEITTEHVLEALKPIWSVKPVTASRTRQRIERYHNFRRDVLEFCLSHRIGDEAELSYWDSEMIARRREALQAWADFIKPRKNTSGEQPSERKRPKLKLVAYRNVFDQDIEIHRRPFVRGGCRFYDLLARR